MKYLKYFESSDSSFYFKISSDEFFKRRENIHHFSDIENDVLSKYFIEVNKDYKKAKYIISQNGSYNIYYETPLIITKVDDDWFLVVKAIGASEYYKCDRIDGVIKFLDSVL